MAWLLLAVAIVFEVVGTSALKLSDGFTRLWPSVTVIVCYGLAFVCLARVLRHIEVGIAYAVWAGAGTALIALIGIAWFGESVTTLKLTSLALVVAGVVGLNVASPQ